LQRFSEAFSGINTNECIFTSPQITQSATTLSTLYTHLFIHLFIHSFTRSSQSASCSWAIKCCSWMLQKAKSVSTWIQAMLTQQALSKWAYTYIKVVLS